MQGKRLLIALAVLAVLGGGIWWSNRSEKLKASQPDPKAPPKITDIKRADISKIEIARAGGETTVLEIPKENEFKLTAPAVYAVDKDAAQSLLSAVSELTSDKVIEEKPQSLDEFGLASPRLTVTVSTRDGKSRKISLGDDVPVGGGAFAAAAGDPRVFLLGSYAKDNLDKKAADLRDKRLLRFTPETLARIAITGKGPAIEFFKRGEGDWTITVPKPMRADNLAVEELVRKLGEAKLDPSLTTEQNRDLDKQFGSSQPLVKVAVSGGDGTQSLELRKSRDGKFYARSSLVEGAHLLSDDVGKSFEKNLDDYRNKKLFDFGFSEPTRIEYKDEKTSLTAVRSQEKWLRGGKTLDNVGVQSLIDKLRDLAAVSWPDGTLGTVQISASVVSNDGKRTEKVSLARQGEKWRAQRDGEAELYEIENSVVEDLKSAAAAVKEQEPPKPPAPAKK